MTGVEYYCPGVHVGCRVEVRVYNPLNNSYTDLLRGTVTRFSKSSNYIYVKLDGGGSPKNFFAKRVRKLTVLELMSEV